MLDTIMIEFFYGERYVGLYSNATRFVRVIYSICIAFVATFYPKLSYYIKNDMRKEYNALLSRGLQVIRLIVMPCRLGIVLLAKDIITILFGSSFIEATFTLRILSILILVFSLAYLMGHIFLISLGAESQILKATIIGAVMNLILNTVLIPLYKHNGAAAASILSEIAVTFIMIKFSKNYFSINVSKKDLRSESIALLMMGVSIIGFLAIFEKSIYRLIVIIPCAAIIYFGSLLITKHSFVKSII